MYLDGSPNIDVGDNQSQYTQASVDTIAEFRVLQSGFNAEYGRNSGMVIAVQTKSGAAQFHGTAYEYLRNNYFDAKCVQCNTLQPQLRYNQFGGNFSGWVPMPKISTQGGQEDVLLLQPGDDAPQPSRQRLRGCPQLDHPERELHAVAAYHQHDSMLPTSRTAPFSNPARVTRDGSGNITGGTPFPNNTVPAIACGSRLSANMLKIYTGIPGYTQPRPPRPESRLRAVLLQQPRQSGEEPGHAAHGLRHQQQDDQFLPLGERLPERDHSERNLDRRAVPDAAASAAEAGQFVGVEPGDHVHAHAGIRDDSVLQPPVAVAVGGGHQSASIAIRWAPTSDPDLPGRPTSPTRFPM